MDFIFLFKLPALYHSIGNTAVASGRIPLLSDRGLVRWFPEKRYRLLFFVKSHKGSTPVTTWDNIAHNLGNIPGSYFRHAESKSVLRRLVRPLVHAARQGVATRLYHISRNMANSLFFFNLYHYLTISHTGSLSHRTHMRPRWL
ncbi:hypothetical protein CEXT_646101 [Caerostris extrusa]|uniref:Uncharacterized protein n=1 Tax=Caerostris extrusa TaxID=172846 RepID=A0AAV4N4Z7_CAEEX|nr:hypothetical protein CEXT_646101 [Caerostris extrusa]